MEAGGLSLSPLDTILGVGYARTTRCGEGEPRWGGFSRGSGTKAREPGAVCSPPPPAEPRRVRGGDGPGLGLPAPPQPGSLPLSLSLSPSLGFFFFFLF